ncbi:hypothetical protein [Aurantibacter sp.]|uniref:hypothetical protein n=1 Tax=Aurantibacter sp. TaxID=2807103 RepID=UPI0035C7AC49
MNEVIKANVFNLNKLKKLLNCLSEFDYQNNGILPYKSSIGNHTRHILDFYECIIEYDKFIDLTKRNRDCLSNVNIDFALKRLSFIISYLEKLLLNEDLILDVYDDLGFGKTKIKYTYTSLLAYVNSHTTHHYASIGYLLHQINPENNFFDVTFGININTLSKFK